MNECSRFMTSPTMMKNRCRWIPVAVVLVLTSNRIYSYTPLHSQPLHPCWPTSKPIRSSTRDAICPAKPIRFLRGGKDHVLERNQRRKLIGSTIAASFGVLLNGGLDGTGTTAAAAAAVDDGFEVIKTPSGLKYLDLIPGTGRTPEYGELLSIAYTGYIKLPATSNNKVKKYSSEPQKFDRVEGYLLKHGNGKTIAGLDEGLHTMKEGGTRRILIPPKLGFVDVGLGPLPELPWDRDKLNRLLDQMVELSGGTLIYEVTLKTIIIDEADQGYYQDETISPEDFQKLRSSMQQQAAETRLLQQALDQQPKNSDKIV